jgi:hypothetical protein
MKTQVAVTTNVMEQLPLGATISHLKTEVQFGSPKDKCKGLGICRVTMLTPLVNAEERTAKRAIAFVSLGADKQLKFSFQKESLSALVREIHFQHGKFVVMDEYEFPTVFAKRIDLESFTIKPGIYEIEETELFLTVTFGALAQA